MKYIFLNDISSQTHVGECLQSDNNFHECSLYWTIMSSTPKVAMFHPRSLDFPKVPEQSFFSNYMYHNYDSTIFIQ